MTTAPTWLAAAQALYRVLRNTPCKCVTKWEKGERVTETPCTRCVVLKQWEAAAVEAAKATP